MLLSLQLIVQDSAPLRESQVFGVLVEPLSHEILLVVLAGAMLTWAAHSSVAIVLLIMSLAGPDVPHIQLALALVPGANLGPPLTPVGHPWGSPDATAPTMTQH